MDVRATLAYEFGRLFGAFGHVDASSFYVRFRHAEWIESVRSEATRSKETFVEHFETRYADFPDLPISIATETMSFGAVSKMFFGMDDRARKAVATRQLLTPTDKPPELTAMNEGAIAAIYAAVGQMVVSEIEMESDLDEMGTFDAYHWRKLVLDVARADGCPSSELPAARCRDEGEWECLLDSIAMRVLWDDDYMDTEAVLDATPASARRYRRKLGIERDYFIALAPDPKESEIPASRERLRELCRGDQQQAD